MKPQSRSAHRRDVLTIALLAGLAGALPGTLLGDPSPGRARQATMYKPLHCGCCDEYARVLERNGFEVQVESLRSLREVKRMAGVPQGFEGCHTLLVDGYTVDGLVPMSTLERLLTERPPIRGITLPGMPWGAPGMQQRPQQGPLVIYAIDRDGGASRVYARE